MTENLPDKIEDLKKRLKGLESLVVSYSGGVDSTVLAILAHRVLGDRMVCVLIKSPLMPGCEQEYAVSLAKELSLPLIVRESDILKNPGFTGNQKDRCYICKKESAGILRKEAERLGFLHIADGTNYSDTQVFRPGFQAGCEEKIAHPLSDAGMTKEDIRKTAELLSLPNSNKPSASCLATRIPYKKEIRKEDLLRIETAEDVLHSLGISGCRVRELCGSARIEVFSYDMQALLKNRDIISKKLKKLGFKYITMDLDGFVSGSMDR